MRNIFLWQGVWGAYYPTPQVNNPCHFKFIISKALPITFHSPALILTSIILQKLTRGTTKAHMFTQWTTTAPPGELIGPWDQGVSITVGPSGHLGRGWIAYNTHYLTHTWHQCVCTSGLSRAVSRSTGWFDFIAVSPVSWYSSLICLRPRFLLFSW